MQSYIQGWLKIEKVLVNSENIRKTRNVSNIFNFVCNHSTWKFKMSNSSLIQLLLLYNVNMSYLKSDLWGHYRHSLSTKYFLCMLSWIFTYLCSAFFSDYYAILQVNILNIQYCSSVTKVNCFCKGCLRVTFNLLVSQHIFDSLTEFCTAILQKKYINLFPETSFPTMI